MIRFVFIMFCFPFLGMAQVNAVTEDGYQIQVFEDGTWKYVDTTLNEKRFIKVNDKVFNVPESSSFELASKVVDVHILLNEEDWYFMPSSDQDVTEFSFNNKNVEIYGLMISENAKIPLENLRNIAIINARDNVENLKLIEEEYRLVNNLKLLYLCYEGEVEKLPLRYHNYYYSGEDGIVQFITYARKDIAVKNADRMLNLLNGFTKSKD